MISTYGIDMNHGFLMIPKVHELVDHVIVFCHRVGILSNICRELSVFIIVQQERETSAKLTDCKRLFEVVDVDLVAECASDFSLSES